MSNPQGSGEHNSINKTKEFKYPPISPIVYYEGTNKWTTVTRLHDRIYLSDVLGEFIPDYRCIMVQLNEYTNQKLMEKKDELSIIMMLNKLQERKDFVSLKEEMSIVKLSEERAKYYYDHFSDGE